MPKITKFLQEFKHIIDNIEKLASEVNFSKRAAKKISPLYFVLTTIFSHIDKKCPSLVQYSVIYEKISHISICEQAFWNRITPEAVNLLEKVFYEFMDAPISAPYEKPKLLKAFTRVLALDSTGIELPEELKDKYPGSGGCASQASLKIQALLDVLERKMIFHEITAGNRNDQGWGSNVLDHLVPNDLLLHDLGYPTLKLIETLTDKGIYFVSRFPFYQWNLYRVDGKHEKINLLELLKRNPGKKVDLVALVGDKHIPIRIIAYPLKLDVVAKRREDAKKKRNKKGKEAGEEYLEYLGFGIYMTNAGPEKIKTSDVYTIYRFRWQIELLFKLWKTKMDLGYLSGITEVRIEFELYAKLLALLYEHLMLSASLSLDCAERDIIEYSPMICFDLFSMMAYDLIMSWNHSKRLTLLLKSLWLKIASKGRKSKSRKKLSTLDRLKKYGKGGYPVERINDYDVEMLGKHFRESYDKERIC